MKSPDPSIRLAVTGMGVICSIGRDKREVWDAIRESRAGIGKLTRFEGEVFPTDIAAEVELDLDGLLPFSARETRRMSRTDQLAIVAAAEAIAEANEGCSAPIDP